jgi:hypothetical protein
MVPTPIEVHVYADHVDPPQLVLDAGEAVRLQIVNSSGETCAFHVGKYVTDLDLAPGERKTQSFTVPSLPGAPSAEHSTTTFGCADDEARDGNVVVMPRPSA